MANELGLVIKKNQWKMPMSVFFKDARLVFKWDDLGKEILGIAFPAALAVAADPIASLIDTIFVGHIGAVELAAVGVSVAIFNQASRITIFPLVSITTSFVAEEDTIGKTAIKPVKGETEKHLTENGRKRELTLQDETKKENMLEKSSSASLITKETRNSTLGNGTIHDLEKNPNMLEKKSSEEHDGKRESPSLRELQLGRFLKNGSLLLARVIAVTFCVTLAASMAARLGPTPMAAFQTCLQVWMTSSLLADGLVGAKMQMSFVLGVGLAVIVAVIMYFGAGIFSGDVTVQALIHVGVPFVAATQPMNSLAFVFDGVNFGASDFAYSAYSLTLVSIATILSLFLLSKTYGFLGIWTALAIYMALRTLVGLLRMGSGTGPWRYLRGSLLP